MENSKTAGNPGSGVGQQELLQTVEVATGSEVTFTVIWLHGLGADGHDFEPVVPQLGLGSTPSVRFVFPHAPVRPVTLNGGMPMRAWYDISAISASRDQDEQGILNSSAQVEALIQRECERGIPCERQILAGFSQGGAMALYTGLRLKQRLAGVLALSSYLLFPERLAGERSSTSDHLPVFVGHGTQDPMVPHAMGQASVQALQALDYQVTWRSYPIPHSVSMDELNDIGQWLRARMV